MIKKIILLAIAFAIITPPHDTEARRHRAAKAQRVVKKQGTTAPGGLQPATDCANCHADVYRNWLNSHHAHSYDNPVFQAAYNKAYTDTKGAVAKECLECHAPTTIASHDYDAKLELTREGVTCDFCHSLSEANPEKNPQFKLQPGRVKITSGKSGAVEGHETAFSKDFASSRLCAVCHDFSNRKGVHTETTYYEWKNSEYAKKGIECQKCHMQEIESIGAETKGRQKIFDHSFEYGVLSPTDAVLVEAKTASVVDGVLVADVMIQNKNAGHFVPTGTLARGLVLEVNTLDSAGKTIETKKTVFSKEVLTADGKETTACADAYLYGCKAGKDNRLAPGESRHVPFNFSNRVKSVASVEARAYFLYRPIMIQQAEIKTPVSESVVKVIRESGKTAN